LPVTGLYSSNSFCAKVIVKPLADAEQRVPVPDRQPQQLQLLEGRRIGNEVGSRVFGAAATAAIQANV
jgi:hypothetical protein